MGIRGSGPLRLTAASLRRNEHLRVLYTYMRQLETITLDQIVAKFGASRSKAKSDIMTLMGYNMAAEGRRVQNGSSFHFEYVSLKVSQDLIDDRLPIIRGDTYTYVHQRRTEYRESGVGRDPLTAYLMGSCTGPAPSLSLEE